MRYGKNFPNPLTREITAPQITFALPEASMVTLQPDKVLGPKVCTLFSGARVLGEHSVLWNGRDAHRALLPNGAYFYELHNTGQVLT